MPLTKLLIACLLLTLLSCQDEPKKTTASRVETRDSIPPVMSKVENPYVSTDKSPMDMSYLPADYPLLKMANRVKEPPVARIIYSRPRLQGRTMFGEELKYGVPWRLGANECTEIQFFKPVKIQEQKIPAARYKVYCVPYADRWTVALNSKLDAWCLQIDTTKDLHRFNIPITADNQQLEFFTIVFEKKSSGADLVMGWGPVLARLPIEYETPIP